MNPSTLYQHRNEYMRWIPKDDQLAQSLPGLAECADARRRAVRNTDQAKLDAEINVTRATIVRNYKITKLCQL